MMGRPQEFKWRMSSSTPPTAVDTWSSTKQVKDTIFCPKARQSRRRWHHHSYYSLLVRYLFWIFLFSLQPSPQPPLSSHPRSPLFIASRLSSIFFLQSVQAQAPQPIKLPQSTIAAGFARTETQFIILGGISTVNNLTNMPLVHQFFYLDLTSQWTNNIPVWAFLGSGNGKEIASDPGVGIGGPTLFSPSMAVSSDSNYLNTFGGMGALAFSYRYSFTTGVWSISQAKVLNKNQRMVQAAMDPSTNLVYFAGGFENATDVDNNLSVYSFQDDTLTNSLTIPTTIPEGAQFPVLTDRKYYSVVYSKSLQGFLYFGGFSNNNQKSPNPGVLTVYNPKTNTWSVPTTKGAGPAHRSNLCMASNDKTAEVVVFAGMLDYEQLAQDIWFLNTTDWSWTQGPNYTEPRAYHTCTISNNTFISWGGWNGRGPTDNTLVLFNLNTKNYTDVYTPPEGRMIPQNPGQPGGGLTNGGDGGLSSKQLAKIIGGSAAGLLILMAIAGACLYIYRRNKALRQQIENLGQDERDEDEDEEGEKTGESRYSDLASSRTSPSTMVLNRSGYRHQQVPSMFGLGSIRNFFRKSEGYNRDTTPMKDAFLRQERRQKWTDFFFPSSSSSQRSLVTGLNPQANATATVGPRLASSTRMQQREKDQQSLHTRRQQEMRLLEARIQGQQELIQLQQRELDPSLLRDPQLLPSGTSSLLDLDRLGNSSQFYSKISAPLQPNQLPTSPEQRLQRRLQNIHPSLFVPPMMVSSPAQEPQFNPIHIVTDTPPWMQQLQQQHHHGSALQVIQQQQEQILLPKQSPPPLLNRPSPLLSLPPSPPQHPNPLPHPLQQQQILLQLQVDQMQLRQQLELLQQREQEQDRQRLHQLHQQQQQLAPPILNYSSRPTAQ